jgi:hypothetical protein
VHGCCFLRKELAQERESMRRKNNELIHSTFTAEKVPVWQGAVDQSN